MREYGQVSPKFWTGETGKSLRGNPELQVLAIYLMTSPHSDMIGIYHLPIMYLCHETGLGLEGASKGLESLSEMGFCLYDEKSEYVWVKEFAKYQVGASLSEGDNRVKSIQKRVDLLSDGQIKDGFIARYAEVFHLNHSESPRGSKGASKPPCSGLFNSLVSFESFWAAYPKKKNRGQAEKVWAKFKPSEDLLAKILRAVEVATRSDDWRKENGQFIPYPASWLNAKGWEDQPTVTIQPVRRVAA